MVRDTNFCNVKSSREESPLEDQDLALADRLFHLTFVLQARLARVAATHDLSVTQVRLLGILRDREPGMLQLARYLDLEKSSLSGLIDRAQARGLVERVASEEDRRSTHVRITAQGLELARRVARLLAEELAHLTTALGDKDKRALGALVDRLIAQDREPGDASG